MRENIIKLICHLVCTLFIVTIVACSTTAGGVNVVGERDSEIYQAHDCKKKGKGGLPPYEKVHGCQTTHTYHYYPNAKVYFDVSNEVYFYMKGESWQVSPSLPGGSHVQLGDYVAIQMDSDKPYTRFNDHKRIYPHDKCKNIKL